MAERTQDDRQGNCGANVPPAERGGYEAKPGSTAYRVLAHLEALPLGAELMGSAIAEAIGVPPSSIGPCLEPALTAGLVFRRQRASMPKSPYWYSLTQRSVEQEEAPAPQPEPEKLPAADPEPAQAVAKQPPPAPRPHPRGNLAQRLQLQPRDTLTGANATMSLSGEIAIVSECGTVVLFAPARARQLVAFLKGTEVPA